MEDFRKLCTRCNTEKSLTEFYRVWRGREARNGYCKICSNELRMQSYLRNEDGERPRKHRWYCKDLDGQKMRHKEWRDALRQKARDYFSDRCFLCDKKVFVKVSDYNIHHKYGTNNHNGHALWHPEDWQQCVLLCRACHYMLHGARRLPRERFLPLLRQLERGK